MTTKLYEIRDYSYEPGWVSYVNEDTTSVVDAWTTSIPLDVTKIAKYEEHIEHATPPKQFAKKIEAKEYLDALRSARLQDWNENGYYYKARGRRKPAWKIYPVPVEKVAQ